MKFPAWYGIIVGCLMIAQGVISILTGGGPELQSEPWRIGFHLVAEFSTALMLVLGGALWSVVLLLPAGEREGVSYDRAA